MSQLDDNLDDEEDLDELPSIPGVGRAVELTVQMKTAGMRLDHYLVLQFADFSRSIIQKAIEADSVTINEQPTKRSAKVKQGDRVRIWLPTPARSDPVPEDIPLDVLYEDEYLAVVNKPYDMVVHPARGNWTGTLVNALAFRFQHLSTLNGEYRPGIVHRLDRDTSGAILVAKEERTHRDLGMQFEMRTIFKEYVAITQGLLDRDSDYIEKRIAHHPHDRIKMIATDDEEQGKEACTYYEVQERFRGHTFVRCQPAHWANAPDSRSSGERWLPGAGGQDVQRPGRVSAVGPDAASRSGARRGINAAASASRSTAAADASAHAGGDRRGSTAAAGVRAHTGGATELGFEYESRKHEMTKARKKQPRRRHSLIFISCFLHFVFS